MPIYKYRCDCGQDFERIMPMNAEAPPCPDCGSSTRKIPAGFSIGGGAAPIPARPTSSSLWREAFHGKPEKVRRELEFRQRLEAKHVGDQAPRKPGIGSEQTHSAGAGPSVHPTPPN